MSIRFAWDERKAVRNKAKHDVSFELSRRVFSDPFAVTEPDRIEDGEQRWQTIGSVDGSAILLVAHTEYYLYDGDEVVRIISARRATPPERRRYEKGRFGGPRV